MVEGKSVNEEFDILSLDPVADSIMFVSVGSEAIELVHRVQLRCSVMNAERVALGSAKQVEDHADCLWENTPCGIVNSANVLVLRPWPFTAVHLAGFAENCLRTRKH